VKAFWVEEFAKYTDRMAAEAVPAIQNKIGQFTANPLIRNIVGQPKSSFDIRKLMDERKILIINLSKGRVGEANANLLGSMMITKIYLAAMSRADVQEKALHNLPNFYLYVDEFQSFANESFADILSEARKYKLNLTIAHQYVEQMSEEVRAAVFGNVGTMITFRVGAYDAEVLEKEFAPQFTAEDLVNLGMFQMYLKLMIDGVGSTPFSASSLPPYPEPIISYKSEIIQNSRKNYSKPRGEVEDNIRKWIDDAKNLKRPVASTSTSSQAPSQYSSQPQKTYAPRVEPVRTEIKKTTYTPRPETPVSKVVPVKTEKPKYKKELPPIEPESDDEFIPLKELVKKVVVPPEPIKETESKPQAKQESPSKVMNPSNLADLRSALFAVMNKSDSVNKTPEVKTRVEPTPEPVKLVEPEPVKMKEPEQAEKTEKKEAPKEEKKDDTTYEIPEQDLRKILGL
jgi:hypothetical protein